MTVHERYCSICMKKYRTYSPTQYTCNECLELWGANSLILSSPDLEQAHKRFKEVLS